MQNTLAVRLFSTLNAKEITRFGKFLRSPYHNHREDMIALFDVLRVAQADGWQKATKETVFSDIWPAMPFDRIAFNLLVNRFSERLEAFLAIEELLQNPPHERLLRCRAFRKRGLNDHFETNALELEQQQTALPHRDADFWLFAYQLQREIFAKRIVERRADTHNFPAITEALTNFFLLDNLKWTAAQQAQQAVARQTYAPSPLGLPALQIAETTTETENPALALMYAAYAAAQNPDEVAAFWRLKTLLEAYVHLFPAAESRDLYMTAINCAIRRHNRGDRAFTREAFDLYRAALEQGILFDSGQLAKYTYTNINALAHVVGASDWALLFLEKYRDTLPIQERENTWRYNLAFHYYRLKQYDLVLPLLQTVEFKEPYTAIDVRKMLLRSYYELAEWHALDSLLDSFQVFLQRQKNIGYQRENYLNLIKFIKKLLQIPLADRKKRLALAEKINGATAVAEREWLLEKVRG